MSIIDMLKVLLLGYPVTPELLDPDYPLFIQTLGGLLFTLVLTVISLFLGFCTGVILAILCDIKGKKLNFHVVTRRLTKACISSVMGLPLMIIVLLVYYYPFVLFHVRLPGQILAVIAMSIFASVYMCEIQRSGFKAVDNGLLDTAKVLGMSKLQVLWIIRIPIAIRVMLPSIIGLAITIFIDSSVLVVVAVPDLMYTARQMVMADPARYVLIFSLVLIAYWIVATTGSWFVTILEKKWDRLLFHSNSKGGIIMHKN